MCDVPSWEVPKKHEAFLLLRDSSLAGDAGHNLKKINSLKWEPEAFWEGITEELILKERIVFVFFLLLKVLSVNWIYQHVY